MKAAVGFKKDLGSRIDAFERVSQALRNGESGADAAARALVRSLLDVHAASNMPAIREAAGRILDGSGAIQPAALKEMLGVLREHAARPLLPLQVVLVVGGDPSFNASLSTRLASADREVLCVPTLREATGAMAEREVIIVLLNPFLPDGDGRSFLEQLRQNPLTVAMPVLLTRRLPDSFRDDELMSGENVSVKDPQDVEQVVAWITSRLRRARETVHAARRDPVTGLLNHAAFRESFARMVEENRESGEPIVMAMLAIDEAAALFAGAPPAVRDSCVQAIAGALSSSVRATDVVGRHASFSFALLLSGTDMDGGRRAVEKIISRLKNQKLPLEDGSLLNFTLSVGLSLVVPGRAFEEAAVEAEHCLHLAAAQGGGRVVMSGRSESIRRAARVLLVVQEKTTSLVLRQVLEKEGFTVMPIHAPEDAPAGKTGRNKFHLIVIDSELPDEAGFKLLEDFRRQQRYSRVPIIMLTSRNSEPDAMRAFELGANEYVSRPISPTGFAARVRHQLARGVSAERQATTYRLLLADDEANVLLTTGTALHRHGTFTVYLACGGKDVCDRFDEIVPNVVLLDHGMLAARGGAVAELLERMKRTGEAKVLLAVGEGVTVAAETLEECGVQGTIRKPYQLLTLGDQIQAVAGLPARPRKSTPSPEHLNNEIERVLGVQVEK